MGRVAAARRRIEPTLRANFAAQSRAKNYADWIEDNLHLPEGRYAGHPVKLTLEQRAWLAQIYDTPTRMFILSMGRKNAKTAFCAMLLLLHLCGPAFARNSQLYSAAQSRDQAAVTFDLAAKMVRLSPKLLPYVTIRDTAKELLCPELGTFYKALSAEVTTSFGKSPVLVVHDELGQVRGPRSPLFDALETACAAHDNPLSLIISTQAATDEDLLSLLIDDAKTGADPRNKVVLYVAPNGLDPFGDDAIRAANPHFDVFMNQDEVRKQAQDAKRMPSRETSYRNLVLNQRVEAHDPFVSRAVWMSNGDPPLELVGHRRQIYGGLDLSSVSDLTALVTLDLVDGKWNVQSTFWLPAEGLSERARTDRVPYDLWHRKGLLNTCPGASIDYAFIARELRTLFDEHDVKALAFDRWNWRFLKPYLEREGFTELEIAKFVEFGQGYMSMSPALRELENMLLKGSLRHGNHPVLTMCAANATIVQDPAENRKFVKHKGTRRIDGMVALAMAVGVMYKEEPREVQMFFV